MAFGLLACLAINANAQNNTPPPVPNATEWVNKEAVMNASQIGEGAGIWSILDNENYAVEKIREQKTGIEQRRIIAETALMYEKQIFGLLSPTEIKNIAATQEFKFHFAAAAAGLAQTKRFNLNSEQTAQLTDIVEIRLIELDGIAPESADAKSAQDEYQAKLHALLNLR